jgi:sarcosine oxidase subunit alpha
MKSSVPGAWETPLTDRARLATGGTIDRSCPVSFTFNGKSYRGYQGDTLASALLANGVSVVGRSFKYHRPRGIFTAGEEEPCALVETGQGASRVPTCRAPMVPLTRDLVANSQNCWPSVDFDVGRLVDLSHPLWPAGFYNKTFKWPSWHTWEGLIRRSAGLGRPLTEPDPDHYEQFNAHCDLLICGGGPAGLVAALAAGRAGLRVILADQGEAFGGSLNWERYEIDGQPGIEWVSQVVSKLEQMSNVISLPRTTVSGVYDHHVTTLLQRGNGNRWRECFWTVRPGHILLATGAIEQGLIFPNNDRPGIMLAGAVRHYLNRYAVKPGQHVVVVTNNDTAYQTVFDLAREHIRTPLLVDTRKEVDPELQRQLAELDTRLLTDARIADTRGGKGIRSVKVQGHDGSDLGTHACDLLAVSGGWAPRVHLLAHARGALQFDPPSQSFIPDELPAGMSVTGSANGSAGLQEILAESARVTQTLVERLGKDCTPQQPPQVTRRIIESRHVGKSKVAPSRRRQWIDLAHDVTFGDAELAVREGYVSVEHFKRYTTTGMSVDQGKTGNLNAFIVLGALTGRPTGEVGTTTYRPPYTPVTLGAIAGRNTGEFYAPRRYLPAHRAHQERNACFEDYGWQRPDYYLQAGESPEAAIRREVRTVRSNVGVFDNSPIGKIEVRGPDAARFLDRIYMNNVASLRTHRARYGLMLNENGVIIDDGVFVKLANDHFLVNTTSGGVARIADMMEEWLQCEWRDLEVVIDDVTSQWANFTIAGPHSASVIESLGTDIDLSGPALPHMSAATGHVAGLEARIVRVSFSGERSYEINVPAAYAPSFFEAVMDAGQPHGIEPYGVEALMMLRLEKGYLHVGSDTDGSSTPDDVGWGHVARAQSGDYIGKRSLYREGNQDNTRKQLVGLEPLDSQQAMRPGGHLLIGADRQPPAETDGWITSACFSPTLDRYIALGVLRSGRDREGEILTVCDEDQRFNVKVVAPVFYDPDNEKLRD